MISAHSDNLPKTYQNVLSTESKIWQDREFAAHTPEWRKTVMVEKEPWQFCLYLLNSEHPKPPFFSLKSIVKALIQNGT